MDNEPNNPNASGKAVPIVGTIFTMVHIEASTEFVTFLVADRLATSLITGCDFCDRHGEAIKPILTIVKMGDGPTGPIVRLPSKANKNLPIT